MAADIKTKPEATIPPGQTVPLDIAAKVDEVINNRGVLDYFTKTIERTVIGNKLTIKLILLVCAQRGLKNGHGVYLDVNGESGGGKSHTVRQVLWNLPREIVMDSNMSPQAIFHENALEPKVYYIDDFNGLDESLKSTLKNVLTNFRLPTVRGVAEKTSGGISTIYKAVPPRTVIIFSAVDSIGDIQLMNRLIPTPVEYDANAKKMQHDYQNDIASGSVPDLECIEDERVIVCREAFKALTSKPLEVVITFAHEIEWPEHDYKNTRNYNVFLDLIKLCAIYEQRNREVDENNRIIANYDDFYLAASIYAPRREMNDTKLSEGPQKVFDLLIRHKDQSYTQAEIVEALKIPQASLSRYLKTLQEMSLIIEDKGVREIGCKTVEIDGMGRPKEIDDTRFTYPNVYQYKGNGIESNIYDTPLTLSLKEKAKPEYQKWLEDKI